MLSTDVPTKLPIPFGNNAGGGFIRAIPVASQIGITDGAASLHDGFVPLNATPISAGGIPPDVKDMNGVLFEISAWSRWQAAGGPVLFDAAFQTLIGGYPKWGVVQPPAGGGVLYVSLVENNTFAITDATKWQSILPVPATTAELATGTDTVKYATPAALAGLRASTAEILAGSNSAKYMSPLSFYGARASNADVIAGTDDHKYLTPLALATGNSIGYIVHPGGIIEQYGYNIATRGEGQFNFAFPAAFPVACDHMIIGTIQNVNDFGHVHDIWASWWQAGTSASQMGITVQGTGGGPSPNNIDGFTWVARGH